ncbi:hypothetical protein CC1G_12604 [Coprinopsis cinerea okayama7|uniref:Uncharacterized protein n=1 Tax=Coprinopsis cinerea (strain Okayama-7 / 130 / ATCC MYA-4618 / FGSC 9003) TaxID=240176 RepID=A8NP64_COPC7|nr:hypothetical protein CC1G_12604 [Coprinopsis cinerea okayama7\|eukprot:XP_001835276.2 hypothetical protein CC1G_12604 [Coprinopsis cinerea okayama7\
MQSFKELGYDFQLSMDGWLIWRLRCAWACSCHDQDKAGEAYLKAFRAQYICGQLVIMIRYSIKSLISGD